MQITVLCVGSSLLAPLKNAEREINRDYKLDLRIATYNFGSPLNDGEWREVQKDLRDAAVVFVIHVMDGENAVRLLRLLELYTTRHHAVVVINCMTELMQRTRMGSLDISRLVASRASDGKERRRGEGERNRRGAAATGRRGDLKENGSSRAVSLLGTVGSWVNRQIKARDLKTQTTGGKSKNGHGQFLKLIDRLPGILRFIPTAGTLRDIKNYLQLFCYFLQPTPANIRSMLLYALREYVPDGRVYKIKVPPPEKGPAVGIYHPDAPGLFATFESYEKWYRQRAKKRRAKKTSALVPAGQAARGGQGRPPLQVDNTVGLLLMRPQVISKTTKHYDSLIRAIEAEGLSVIPAISTLMDNRHACQKFFVAEQTSKVQRTKTKAQTTDHGSRHGSLTTDKSRVSQIVSLTGFSFVGGPAMNDSAAASGFLCKLNQPYRSVVSLDTQTIEAWSESQTGLNPVQAGMQIAIPEIDGATEPFVYGGIPSRGLEPVALDDRCGRFARRLKRWNRLRTAARGDLKLALVLFCFPPNKGNIGTAADLDVFPSVFETLLKLNAEGYTVDLPSSSDELREKLLGGNSERFGATANIAHRMSVDEYRLSCPYVDEIEAEWGPAPGRINSFGNELLIPGIRLGNVFLGVQPTFGFEGDPMRLMMARGGAPHHGFMAFYTYLSGIINVDAVVHVGTHGAMEFMPGKQIGLSRKCWPDRLVGELPNIYIYSVNNPSEGSVAKRRSYAELISYLTPPMENAGLYKELASLKDLLVSYRQASDERDQERLFTDIEEYARKLNLAAGFTRA